MATITIRNVDEDTRRALRVRAAMHGRSMEAEIREILSYSAREVLRSAHDPLPFGADLEAPAAGPEAPAEPEVLADPIAPVVIDEEAISAINQQLEKMGFGEFALPVSPLPE